MIERSQQSGPAVDPADVRRAVARHVFGDDDADRVELRETHISWLFLAGELVFKLKKPVRFDFVDYGSAERRRHMCHEEVRLNRRLAATLYVGVDALVAGEDGVRIVKDRPGARDYMVEMRRYDERMTLAADAESGRIDHRQLSALAARLVQFHTQCEPSRSRRGVARTRREVRQNASELYDALDSLQGSRRGRAIERFLLEFVAANHSTLDARARDGRVLEGHGDLRAEHVVLRPRLEVIDCVEFDPELRTVDVADDLGFLVMDLCARGAQPAAEQLIARYREAGGDCGADQLVWFYAAHRALVRAKVAAVRARQSGAGSRSVAEVSELLSIGERCAWRARGQLVVAICGVPASGKSQLADALAARTGAVVIRSDAVRKQLAGLAPTDRAPISLYEPPVTRRTYEQLGVQTASMVAGRGGVLVDATFLRPEHRAIFRAQLAADTPVRFVQCACPERLLETRARRRETDPARISDAGLDVVRAQRRSFEALDEVGPEAHFIVRTDRAIEQAADDVLALLDERVASSTS